MPTRSQTRKTNRDKFLETAQSQIGYQAKPGRSSVYGQFTGYDAAPWSGSFIEYCARTAGIEGPSLVHTDSALAYYQANDQTVAPKKARPGDIVFFAYGLTPNEEPRAAIILANHPDKTQLEAVGGEANTENGLNNEVQSAYYYYPDILAVARPTFDTAGPVPLRFSRPELAPRAHPSSFRSDKFHPDIDAVQVALKDTVTLEKPWRGHWCAGSRASYAAFQRYIGYSSQEATGFPDDYSLQKLSEATGLFVVRKNGRSSSV